MTLPLRKLIAFSAACAIAGNAFDAHAAGGVVVIGNQNIARLDAATLQRIYTGRAVQVDGVPVTVVNSGKGTALRVRFLQAYLKEEDEEYIAYWIKRGFAGLGAAPHELSGSSAIINYVKSTPGAIGYIDEAELEPGVNVLLKP